MRLRILFVGLLVGFALTGQAQGLVNKIKRAADRAVDKAIDKKVDQTVGGNTGQQGNDSPGSSGSHPSNKGGGGLITTPPDVNQNLVDAEAAYKTKKYGEARYAVQQAMLGVEMEIGKEVLNSLPESVNGLNKQADRDQVTSTGWGWVGLTIQREYLSGDKELRTTVANNSAWMSAVNMYLTSGGYAQTTGGEQNWKQTKVKGYKAIIEYDDNSGYKLSVPIGQSSLIVWQGVNFASEQEMMNAANSFDIDGIKKMLGEQ